MVTPTKINDYLYEIEKKDNMNSKVKIFASDLLMKHLNEDRSLQQGINVACLPGICGPSIMMPDAHQGYGFSIGGVAAFDLETGIISPGGVGFDINCGVRLITTNLKKDEVQLKINELLDGLFDAIPTGKGFENKSSLSDEELNDIFLNGPKHLVDRGIGTQDDLNHCESGGAMPGAVPEYVSHRAKARGRKQLGTLGAGNHFLEIQTVGEIFDKDIAKIFGFTDVDQVVFMIHCGSRGLGHQVASDYLRLMEDEYPKIIESLPEKDLIYAPINSDLGKKYYGAMCAAANFAWANRHMIGHLAKEVFKKLFPAVQFRTVYDVAHNIAKRETHIIGGVEKEVMVHRKGATRAFGPGNSDLPADYQTTGQPILIPGSMGTSSFVLVGTKEGMEASFGSTAHGAGRLMSRFDAKKEFDGETIRDTLAEQNISLKARNIRGVGDEAPGAYKDVDEVVKVSHEAHIGNLVVKLKPIGVIKG
ncbi:RtcB family protein [Candidatus Woesearchaeota archaeon]|nr:RtcB family protein [Candidatus Woesearchaeota archaeon]